MKSPRNDIAPQVLRELLRYDPETGKLYWRRRAVAARGWNARYADKEALTADNGSGYRWGSINGKLYLAHRVAWAIVHGAWPERIDHINGDRSDNRLVNLRSVSARENSRNMRIRSDNTSGCSGVSLRGDGKAWTAGAVVGGRWTHLGSHPTKDAAIAARKAAERELGYHPNHGRSAG